MILNKRARKEITMKQTKKQKFIEISPKKTNRVYSNKLIESAIEAIFDSDPKKRLTLSEASELYEVPKAILYYKIQSTTSEKSHSQSDDRIISEKEEKQIVDWWMNLEKRGFAIHQKDLFITFKKIVSINHQQTPFKKEWYHSFIKRHPELLEASMRSEFVLEYEIKPIQTWFDDLEDFILSKNLIDILNDPSRIFYGDESSFSHDSKTGIVQNFHDWQDFNQIAFQNETDTITTFLVISADGKSLPPLVIFPNMHQQNLRNSDTNELKYESLNQYFVQVFNNYLTKNNIERPIIFFIQRKNSCLSMVLNDYCKENGIMLYALPSILTHSMESNYIEAFNNLNSLFKEFDKNWFNCCKSKDKSSHTNTNFCKELSTFFGNDDHFKIIKNSFKNCGIYPFLKTLIVNPSENLQIDLNNEMDYPLEKENEYEQINENFEISKNVLLKLKKKLLEKNINTDIVMKIISDAHEEELEKIEYKKFESNILKSMADVENQTGINTVEPQTTTRQKVSKITNKKVVKLDQESGEEEESLTDEESSENDESKTDEESKKGTNMALHLRIDQKRLLVNLIDASKRTLLLKFSTYKEYKSKQSTLMRKKYWELIETKLNNMGPIVKPVRLWKYTWRRLVQRVQMKQERIHNLNYKGYKKCSKLNELDRRILNLGFLTAG